MATLATLVVVGVPSVIQLTVAPWLLAVLERDWAAIRSGEVWRLVTSLVVQDGGVPGTVSNLTFLAVVGVVAERLWGAGRWVAIALAAGVGAQFWGAVVQPVGGGNSVVVFGLAASLAAVSLRRGRGPARLLGIASLLIAVVLLVIGDLHGGAALIGGVAGAVLQPPRRSASQGVSPPAAPGPPGRPPARPVRRSSRGVGAR